ncbi:MAG: oligopeptide transporter, OPT family [Elusimicrobia bacterium]|nr:oligopeptide transporter, OPT family [Elusimicrobiota bacterium]
MSQPAPTAKKDSLTVYVKDDEKVPEFTIQAVILGFVLSIVFNAANAYLGLKIGLTVSASIPSAIISMGVLRMVLPKLLRRNGTVLENMIVHSIASNGESLAAAIIFTVPALFFMGQTISNGKVFLLGATGGILGMLMMIPLRYSLVVTEHENLPFPEGTACAKVLIAGDKGGASATPVFMGILSGGVFKFLMSGFNLWKDSLMWTLDEYHSAGGFGYDISPLLVGVGYLVGVQISAVMLAGGLLGYFVLIPLIHYIGGHNIITPGTVPIDAMSTAALRSNYVKYIGAGGVAFGGLVSLLKSLPDILSSLRHSVKMIAKSQQARSAGGHTEDRDREHKAIVFGGALLGFLVGSFAYDAHWRVGPEEWGILQLIAGVLAHIVLGGALGAALGAVIFYFVGLGAVQMGRGFGRTEHDLPLPIVGIGIAAMFLLLWLVPSFDLTFLEAAIVVLFCFFFVAVSARMVGLIGTTNQPVSGMTITALLAITVLFGLLGHNPETIKTAAIMGGAVVCIAISLSGDLSQDMKTAILVGATPWKIQLTHIMGTLVSAVRSGFILYLLYVAYGFGSPTAAHPHPLEAPQSQLMAKLVEGATGGSLPWTLLLTGAGIGLICELCGISALAFAIGLYLPITNWPLIMVGGAMAWFVARKKGGADAEHDPGSLFASGLIAGEALMGIALALVVVVDNMGYAPGLVDHMMLRKPEAGNAAFEAILATGLCAAVCWQLYSYALGKKKHA